MTILMKKIYFFLLIKNFRWKIFVLGFLALIFYNCVEKTPSDPDIKNIKDGIITIRFDETCWDKMGAHTHTLDSLNVSEETNVLDIPNAVPFELPSLSAIEIYFWGDFIGVQDTIFIWVKYESNNPNRKKQTVTEMIQLAKNQSSFILLASGSKPIGHANGYIFILDTDNNNSGTGFVRFEGDSLDEKVWVDAAQNTVCYQNNAVAAEFQITCMPFHPEGYEASNFRAYSLDYNSYKNISDRAICVLKIKRDDSITIFAFSTFFGYHKGYLPCSIKVFGFVPNFNYLLVHLTCTQKIRILLSAKLGGQVNENPKQFTKSYFCKNCRSIVLSQINKRLLHVSC